MNERRTIARRSTPRALVVVLAACGAAVAHDTVYLSAGSAERGSTKLVGEVIDYTGRELRLRTPGGAEQTYPGERVRRIEYPTTPQQAEADARFARHEFAAAVSLYEQARRDDARPWVRREITAQIVWCDRALGRVERAGEEFLLLMRSDPSTPYFDGIPLAWIASEPSPELEQAARRWLGQDDVPAAGLLGASHLLTTAARGQVLDRLRRLATDPDRRIALLATAQTWRTEIVTANPRQLESWAAAVDAMPAPLRAGPYYVLGLGYDRQQAWNEAALAWMRIPILDPRHRALAARALVDAGGAMEKLGRREAATRLYDEAGRRFPETAPAAEARNRLEAGMNPSSSGDRLASD